MRKPIGPVSGQLEQLCDSLAERYPPDWYEKLWNGIHLQLTVAVGLMSAWLFAADYPGLVALAPMVVGHGIAVLLPALLWERHAMTPRWAHPKARLTADEQLQVARLVQEQGMKERLRATGLLPVRTGDQFWRVMRESKWIA